MNFGQFASLVTTFNSHGALRLLTFVYSQERAESHFNEAKTAWF
jgi:hypothetical protein